MLRVLFIMQEKLSGYNRKLDSFVSFIFLSYGINYCFSASQPAKMAASSSGTNPGGILPWPLIIISSISSSECSLHTLVKSVPFPSDTLPPCHDEKLLSHIFYCLYEVAF